ncbi:MAG TPA: UDP-N-acetylglucosamine 1-carboxyvinyltransferase [Dehalococcoidia bacterium]|nr:UDP-N-acetylglucosamine 1-carboxyvinyltransferase [Dehalococcoidia bacterium]
MDRLIIEGGQPLRGRVVISGAKNAVLPMMAAALLTSEDVVIEDVPDIDDVDVLMDVLRALGAEVDRETPHRLRIRARAITSFIAPTDLVRKLRGSFLIMGPLLGRFGRAGSAAPGGDVIGQRPIDVHLVGFRAMGARIALEEDIYLAFAPRLSGAKIFMDYPSHIGTENLLMAAVLAEGRTIIRNASQEPEVVDLANLLTKMGARIQGAGSSTIVVDGVDELGGAVHRVIPDRIEAGTFALACAIAGGNVELSNIIPDHLDALIWKLHEAGVTVEVSEGSLRVERTRDLSATNVQALPYPGFPTDLQSTIGVMLTQAHGRSVIHERVYDRRLVYFSELALMGPQVLVRGQTAVVDGPMKLHGAGVRALDIRAGAALTLAGLAAEGRTEILDAHHVSRGYDRFDDKLRALGASIWRELR